MGADGRLCVFFGGSTRREIELLCELKPGEPGTEELVERFGEALVCVRRWYDPERDLELSRRRGSNRTSNQRRQRSPMTLRRWRLDTLADRIEL
jgi:hypothetical protein